MRSERNVVIVEAPVEDVAEEVDVTPDVGARTGWANEHWKDLLRQRLLAGAWRA